MNCSLLLSQPRRPGTCQLLLCEDGLPGGRAVFTGPRVHAKRRLKTIRSYFDLPCYNVKNTGTIVRLP